MSSGLMSCVRENSPPLELDFGSTGQLSLPAYNTLPASTSLHQSDHKSKTIDRSSVTMADAAAVPNNEQQKKRRFHPLRNLRRIFRRRTINSTSEGKNSTLTSSSSASEKNLRSATLSAISKTASASSPSSPLTHQQLHDVYSSQSLPKSKSYGDGSNKELRDALHGKVHVQDHQKQLAKEETSAKLKNLEMYTTASSHNTSLYYNNQHTQVHHRQSVGVAVFPSAMNRNFTSERQKIRSVGDSSQELDSSGNESVNNYSSGQHNGEQNSGIGSRISEISDSQRSLSERRLVDSDFTCEALSQSHDSVFSESATASSLSIVLKAELTDVLRKRRNRPDASDEDLGLPRSPISPQKRIDKLNSTKVQTYPLSAVTTAHAKTGNRSEVSSISLLSINSNDCDEFQATSTANNSVVHERKSTGTRYARSLTSTTIEATSEILGIPPNLSLDETRDDIDFFSGDRHRLSHAAAKHKMAIRPTKKKVPSRLHRKTLEIEMPIPEASEEMFKVAINDFSNILDQDMKTKTRSLPPGVNAKIIEEYDCNIKSTATLIPAIKSDQQNILVHNLTEPDNIQLKKSKEISTIPNSSNITSVFNLRSLTSKGTSSVERNETVVAPQIVKVIQGTSNGSDAVETGFLRRLIHRNSKRSITKAGNDDETAMEQSEPKKLQLAMSCLDTKQSPSYNLMMKSKSAINCKENVEQTRKEIKREIVNEGKSGLGAIINSYLFSNSSDKTNVHTKEGSTKPKSGPAARQRYLPQEIGGSNTVDMEACDKPSRESYNEVFQSTSIIREINSAQSQSSISLSSLKSEQHYEKNPKNLGPSAFHQKITRSTDSFVRTSSNNSMETSTDDPIDFYDEKQRRAVEKSKSLRAYMEENNSNVVHNNMPSMPDLSLSFRVPSAYLGEFIVSDKDISPPEEIDKCVSLGFEINDNNLIKSAASADAIRNNPNRLTKPNKKLILNSTSKQQQPTSTKLLAPVNVVPQLSPTNSCNKNISEIEQNIDMIVKSSFISVVRKPTVSLDVGPQKPFISNGSPNKLDGTTTVFANKTELPPTNAAVALREKTKATNISQKKNEKLLERKSAPAIESNHTENVKSPKRPSSAITTNSEKINRNVPEFLKIQLNRVDPERITRGSVVLAKNIKREPQSPTNINLDDDNSTAEDTSRMHINECQKTVEAHDKTLTDTNLLTKLGLSLPTKSLQSDKAKHDSTPKSPVKNICQKPVVGLVKNSEGVDKTTTNTNEKNSSYKCLVQERKRIFLAEGILKSDHKIEDWRNERKKSINENLSPKPLIKEENTKTQQIVSPVHTADATASENNVVVLRKKSFGTNLLNNNTQNNNSTIGESDSTPELMKVFARRSLKVKDEDIQALTDKVNNGNSTSNPIKKLNVPPTNKQAVQPSVDSDKENQSASEEKLDKLSKCEQELSISNNKNSINITNNTAAHNISNRNSVADFRNGFGKFTGKSNNNHNSSTNLGSTKISHLPPIKVGGFRSVSRERNCASSSNLLATNKVSSNEQNNNKNNNNIENKSMTPTKIEKEELADLRSSLPIPSNCPNTSKAIERSATVGEFKGIHQRRAEWEQRAKETFK